jgi:16S rRNA (guanine966-N2)-methyltransferase
VEGRVRIVASDAIAAVSRLARHGPFDLVLADPPWSLVDDGKVAPLLATLAASGGLADGAVVVLEHSSRSAAPDVTGLDREDTRRYGDAALTFYKPRYTPATAP